MIEYDVEYDADLRDEWHCEACGAGNSRLDGECQWCACGGFGTCQRRDCSAPEHFHPVGSIGYKASRLYEVRNEMRYWISAGLAELARVQRENQAKLR